MRLTASRQAHRPIRRIPLKPDDQAVEVARVVGQPLATVFPDDDGIAVAEAGEAGDVESRLDGKDHVLAESPSRRPCR